MKTTLNKIREHRPCTGGWGKLLTYLGKTQADDEPLAITTIIDSNGLSDAIWCLRTIEGQDRKIRLFAVWCARQVQHLMTDQRSIDALDAAERYANGQATDGELEWAGAAADAARYAARIAAWGFFCTDHEVEYAAALVTWGNAKSAFYAAKSAAHAVDADWCEVEYAAAYAVDAVSDINEMKARQEAELRRICEEG